MIGAIWQGEVMDSLELGKSGIYLTANQEEADSIA